MSNVKGCKYAVKNEFEQRVQVLARHYYDGELKESTGPILLEHNETSPYTDITTGTNHDDTWSIVVNVANETDDDNEIYSYERLKCNINDANQTILLTATEEVFSVTPSKNKGCSAAWPGDNDGPIT